MAFFTQFSTINYDTSLQKRLIHVNEIAFFRRISTKKVPGYHPRAKSCIIDECLCEQQSPNY